MRITANVGNLPFTSNAALRINAVEISRPTMRGMSPAISRTGQAPLSKSAHNDQSETRDN